MLSQVSLNTQQSVVALVMGLILTRVTTPLSTVASMSLNVRTHMHVTCTCDMYM